MVNFDMKSLLGGAAASPGPLDEPRTMSTEDAKLSAVRDEVESGSAGRRTGASEATDRSTLKW